MDEHNVVHTYNRFFSLQKEILTHATSMNLEDITLSKTGQSRKDKYYRIPLTRYLKQSDLQEESRMVSPGAGGKVEQGCSV